MPPREQLTLPAQPILIGVAGCSGSATTTLPRELAAQFEAAVVSLGRPQRLALSHPIRMRLARIADVARTLKYLFLCACFVASCCAAQGTPSPAAPVRGPVGSAAPPSNIPPDPNLHWVDNTSGPFYTGTADVLPGGSFYIEPYAYLSKSSDIYNFSLPLKLAYGLGHKVEADAIIATEYNQVSQDRPHVYQLGDTVAQLKLELHKETDRYRLWRAPSLGISFDLNLPTGHLQNAKTNLAGGSQTTNNTWNEQLNILARKQFKPFELYLEGSEIVQNPTDVTGPYNYNNGLNSVPSGVHTHIVDGNVLAAAATLEHVLIPSHGFGYLIEMNTQRQSGRSLFWGTATAPSFSYLALSPELEVTWPTKGRFPLTWGGGLTTTAFRSNSPRQLTPLFTVTLNGNLHGAR